MKLIQSILFISLFGFATSLLTERDIYSTIVRLPIVIDPTENDLKVNGHVNVTLCTYDPPSLGQVTIYESFENVQTVNHVSGMTLDDETGALVSPTDIEELGTVQYILESTDGGFAAASNNLQISDYFGFAVAITNNWAFVPSLVEDETVGAFYVYQRNGMRWEFFQKIESPAGLVGASAIFDPQEHGDENPWNFLNKPGFQTVSVDREHFFLGTADYTNSDFEEVGAVFIYEYSDVSDPVIQRSEWILNETIEGPGLPDNENFTTRFGTWYHGFGNYLAIGSEENNVTINGTFIRNTGAIYIYRKSILNGWEFRQKLTGPEGTPFRSDINQGEAFQNPVISFNRLYAGAPRYSSESTGYCSGRVYKYTLDRQAGEYNYDSRYFDLYDNPDQAQNETTANSFFGHSISVTGPWLVIGAPGSVSDMTRSTLRGQAHVYKWNGTAYNFFQKLEGSEGHVGDNFGQSINCDHGFCTITAPRNNITEIGQETTQSISYIFEYIGTEWVEIEQVYHRNPLVLIYFGSTKISDIYYPWFLGGAFTRTNPNNPDIEGAGSARIFPLRPLILYDTNAYVGVDHWCYNVTSDRVPDESAEGHVVVDVYRTDTSNPTLDNLINERANNILTSARVDVTATRWWCIAGLIILGTGILLAAGTIFILPSLKK